MPDDVKSLLDEFEAFLNDANAVVGFAQAGLWRVRELVDSLPTDDPANPDPTFYLGTGDPNDPASRVWAGWRRSHAQKALARDGMVEARLSQQWVVSVYTAWEHEYRPRFAAVHSCGPDDVQLPLFGDLRLIRHDVVHHHGIATAKNAGSAKRLRWFQAGDVINLTAKHFVQFIDDFPWNDLATGNWAQP